MEHSSEHAHGESYPHAPGDREPSGGAPPEFLRCAYHQERPAVAYCTSCGKPVCETCLQFRAGTRVCPVCAAALPRPQTNVAAILGGVAAGLLVLALIILVAFGLQGQPEPGPEIQLPPTVTEREEPEEPEAPEIVVPAPPVARPEPAPAPEREARPARSPREGLALAAALEDRPAWVGKVQWRTPDWSEARVWIGPREGEWVLSRALWWDPDQQAYEIMAEGPPVD